MNRALKRSLKKLTHGEEMDAFRAAASVLIEMEADGFFEDEGPNWRYCLEYAYFQHRSDGVCEFILHIGFESQIDGVSEYARRKVEEMRVFGCTPSFITAYLTAARLGATRVLFYV